MIIPELELQSVKRTLLAWVS